MEAALSEEIDYSQLPTASLILLQKSISAQLKFFQDLSGKLKSRCAHFTHTSHCEDCVKRYQEKLNAIKLEIEIKKAQ